MSNTFADTIRQLRINKGLSQLQLADQMYVTHSTISRWEAGSRLPDAMMISRLAKCLETSTEFLFSLISEEKETPNIIMVDDEAIILSGGLPVLEEAFPDANITGFIKPSEARSVMRSRIRSRWRSWILRWGSTTGWKYAGNCSGSVRRPM